MLSDDPYVDSDPVAWLDRRLYLPDLGIGRLVESPADIAAQVDAYVVSGGRISAAGATTTAYDFMKDGGTALASRMNSSLAATTGSPVTDDRRRIDDLWTSGQLLGDLASADRRVNTVFAHFEHDAALSASGFTTGTDAFDPADLRGALPSGAQLLLTMGCHSGLSVPASVAPAGATDFARATTAQGAAYVAVTGFGYGDRVTTGLHERLLVLYAGQLGYDQTLGEAMARAKQRYFATQGLYGNADEKTVATTVLYGLPMYRTGGVVGPAVPAPALTTPVPAGGFAVKDVVLTPTFATVVTPDGTYVTADGQDPLITQGRPVQPRVTQEVTAAGADGSLLPAHGALVTELSVGTDRSGVDGVFSRAVTELSANEPERATSGTVFPAAPAFLTTYGDPAGPVGPDGAGTRQELVVVPGQFIGAGAPESAGLGTQRTFDRVDVRVHYSTSTDWTPPAVGAPIAVLDPATGQVRFTVKASDTSGVSRVLVLYRPDGALDFVPLDLADTAGTWGAVATVPAGTLGLDYLVQVLDGAGNVTAVTGKGEGLRAVDPTPQVADAVVTPGGTVLVEGTGVADTPATVTVSLAAPAQRPLEVPFTVVSGSAQVGQTETVTVRLAAAPGVVLERSDAVVTIVDDDDQPVPPPVLPTLSLADTTAAEGDVGSSTPTPTLTLTLSTPSSSAVTVRARSTGGTATAGTDYAGVDTVLTLPAGQRSTTLPVTVLGDTVVEGDETVELTLSEPSGATLLRGAAVLTITNDDVPPPPPVEVSVTATDPVATERSDDGDQASFTVTRNGLTTEALTVSYSLSGTASAQDYTPALVGSLTIPMGAASATRAITPVFDGLVEPSETVVLTLTAVAGVRPVAPTTATVTIMDAVTVPVTPQILYSVSKTRSSGIPLDGAVLTGREVFVFVEGPDIARVAFTLDGKQSRVENVAPFDLRGETLTGDAKPLILRNLKAGPHVVRAVVTATDGTQTVLTATFRK